MHKTPASDSAAAGKAPAREWPAGYPSLQKRRDALELFELGLGYTRVAQILDLNAETVRDWSRRWQAGTFSEELPKNQYRYPQELKERCIRMRMEGTPWSRISRETGVSVTTVRKWMGAGERPPGG